jgi:hypothetical protein
MQLVSQVRKLESRLIQIEKNHENFQREVNETPLKSMMTIDGVRV